MAVLGTDKEIVRDFFEEMSPSYFAAYSSPDPDGHSFRSRKLKTLEMVDRAFPSGEGKRVLDVGCGPGVMVAELLARKFTVTASDISQGMIDDCHKRFPNEPRLTCRVGDVTALDYPDAQFDLVIAMGLVEYLTLEDIERSYSEMRRVLKPGGTLIVTYPNRSSFYRRTSVKPVLSKMKRLVEGLRKKERAVAWRIKHEFSERDMADIRGPHGLELRDVQYYNFKVTPYPFDKIFPSLAVGLAKRLEDSASGPVRYLGTGFIALFEKE